jgi:hypothetical protein
MSNSNDRIDALIVTLQGLSLDIKTTLDALVEDRSDENEERRLAQNPGARPRKPAVGSGNRGARIEEAVAEQRIRSIQERLVIVARSRASVVIGDPQFRIGDQIFITIINPKVKHSRRGTVTRITRTRVYFRTEDGIDTWRSPRNLTLTFGHGLG